MAFHATLLIEVQRTTSARLGAVADKALLQVYVNDSQSYYGSCEKEAT